MAQVRDVAVLVGSLRKQSLNRMTAYALAKLAPESLKLDIVEIGQLPYYDQDVEADPPQSWTDFRSRIAAADAVLFVSPEYNRSIPAVLKNAVDVGSRPWGASVWNGKPAGVVTVSPGAVGGFGANHHLRQSLVAVNMAVMAHPEAYYGHAGDYFDESGELVNEGTRKVMQRFVDAYADWVERLLAA